jgi:HK97 gp10 family phage protein
MSSEVTISHSLRRLLGSLDAEVTQEMQGEIKEAGDIIEAEILKRVPVDSGDLAHSLARKDRPKRLELEVGYSPKLGKKKWRLAGWRAKFTEYGTRGYTPDRWVKGRNKEWKKVYNRISSGQNHYGTHAVPARPPQPFVEPGYEAARPQIQARLDAALKRLLWKVG